MDDDLYPLSRDLPLWERTYNALERLIVHRRLPPGSRLVESELAAQLQVSRNPVREAIRALEAAGWVTVIPRRGAHVIMPEPNEGDHLFEVRTMFEPEAASLATRRVTDAELEHLRSLLAEGSEAAGRGDADGTVELNAMFHRAVFSAARNPVLLQVLLNLEKRSMWHFSAIATARGMHSWNEHASLVEAMAAGDHRRAAEEMREHVTASREAYRLAEAEAAGHEPEEPAGQVAVDS